MGIATTSSASPDLSVTSFVEDDTEQLLNEAEKFDATQAQIEAEPYREEEPLTQIQSGLRRAESLLLSTPEEPEVRVIGQSIGFPKYRANLVADKTVTFNPVVDSSPPTNYFAPMPSNSFSNISHIEKVIDPFDPLAFNHNRHVYLTIDSTGESEERRRDADYSPSFSCRATSDSDLSIIEPYYRGSNNNNNARSNNNVRTNLNSQARRWASEGPPRRASHRGAKVRAKAAIREALISSKDRADASYSTFGSRRDTPQVSPSIPMNPAMPSVHSAPVAYIQQAGLGLPPLQTNTNDYLLTGPHQGNDAALEVLMRRFENASTSAAVGQMGYRPSFTPNSPQIQRPARRSFLKAAPRPQVTSRLSQYWRDYQTWRKYDGPEPEADAEVVEVVVVSSEHDEADDDDKARDALRENETDNKKTSEAGSDVQII